MDPTEQERAFDQQWQAFQAALPELLKEHEGKWAVFYETLRATFDDEWEALDWAVANLGNSTPFVISQIEEPREILLTAAIAFGMSP